ncbi:MAG: ornithine cyclodeaminase family protein [Desulfurococcales archaeon]|nr:ornithine cyclodeaminase family protein [Desulfurococcales archaeon]
MSLDSIRIITPNEIEKVNKIELVNRMAKAYTMFSEGDAINPPRQVFWVKGNWWGVMSASLPDTGVSVKIVGIIPENPSRDLPTINGIVVYLDPETGSPLAVIDAPILTAYRTAAGSMASSRLLSPLEPKVLSIIGTGYQASVHLKFFKEIHPTLNRVKVFDINKNKVSKFIVEAGKLFDRVEAVRDSCNAVKDADIVLLATTAKEPAINGECLSAPVHVISIGVMGPDYRELDDETVRRAELIAVDSIEAVMREVGDFSIPMKKGLIGKGEIVEIGKLLKESSTSRARASGITVFKSVGIAVQDTAISDQLYSKAYRMSLNRD